MAELLAVAFLGGLITGLSPCIVPVLPVVVAGGSAGTSRARPYLIIGGLVVSFSLTELTGSTVLSALGLPQNFLFWLGIGLLGLLALGLMVSSSASGSSGPSRGSGRRATPTRVAVSCSVSAWALSSCHVPVPSWRHLGRRGQPPHRLLVVLRHPLLCRRAPHSPSFSSPCWRNGPSAGGRNCAHTCRPCAGWPERSWRSPPWPSPFGVLDPLQREVPGYTSALEDHLESGGSIAKQIEALDGEKPNQFAKKAPLPKTPLWPRWPPCPTWVRLRTSPAL
jgi:hypothetical protein